MACANLWPYWLIRIFITAKITFTIFQLWAHKGFVKRAPDTQTVLYSQGDGAFNRTISLKSWFHQIKFQNREITSKRLTSACLSNSVCKIILVFHVFVRNRSCEIRVSPPVRKMDEWMDRIHDDVIKWKHFPRYWPFVRGIHRWPHKG